MLGFGKKDEDGRQVRVEHRGKHARLSRTGGASVRAETRAGPLGATVNSSKGLRLSARLARGARLGLQNGRTQFIGRWRSGPFALNASKSGMSASVKTDVGTLNLLKPRHSSFKVSSVQVRGQNAVAAQLAYMGMQLGFALVMRALRLLTWAILAAVPWPLFSVGSDPWAGSRLHRNRCPEAQLINSSYTFGGLAFINAKGSLRARC